MTDCVSGPSEDGGHVTDSTDHTITGSERVLGPSAIINAFMSQALSICKFDAPSVKESQVSINDEAMTALTEWAAGSPKLSGFVSTIWAQSEDTMAGTVEAWDSTGGEIAVPFCVHL